MVLYGVVSIFVGALIMWQFSTLVGLLFLVIGVGLVGKEYLTPEPEKPSRRDYSSEAPSYDISSKPRR